MVTTQQVGLHCRMIFQRVKQGNSNITVKYLSFHLLQVRIRGQNIFQAFFFYFILFCFVLLWFVLFCFFVVLFYFVVLFVLFCFLFVLLCFVFVLFYGYETTTFHAKLGEAGSVAVLPRRYAPMDPGLIPSAGAVCAFGFQSILASAGFLRVLRFSLLHLKLDFLNKSFSKHFMEVSSKFNAFALLGFAWFSAEINK